MPAELRLVAAIDLGGTKIRTLIVDETGAISAIYHRPTEAEEGPEAVIGRIVTSVEGAAADGDTSPESLLAISVAAPGPVDFERGILLQGPNLPGWHSVPLEDLTERGAGRIIPTTAAAPLLLGRWPTRPETRGVQRRAWPRQR